MERGAGRPLRSRCAPPAKLKPPAAGKPRSLAREGRPGTEGAGADARAPGVSALRQGRGVARTQEPCGVVGEDI